MEGKLKSILETSLNYNAVESEKIVYVITLFLTDFSKFMILSILFYAMGYPKDFMIAFLFTMFLRMNTGGFHFKTYLGCLLFSSTYFSILIFLNRTLDFKNEIIIFSIIGILVILKLAPIISKERSKIKSIRIKNLKVKSLLLSVIYLLIFLINSNTFTRYGVWVVIVSSLLLSIQEVSRHVKKIYQEKSTSNV